MLTSAAIRTRFVDEVLNTLAKATMRFQIEVCFADNAEIAITATIIGHWLRLIVDLVNLSTFEMTYLF